MLSATCTRSSVPSACIQLQICGYDRRKVCAVRRVGSGWVGLEEVVFCLCCTGLIADRDRELGSGRSSLFFSVFVWYMFSALSVIAVYSG
jgi:hypothetical protein